MAGHRTVRPRPRRSSGSCPRGRERVVPLMNVAGRAGDRNGGADDGLRRLAAGCVIGYTSRTAERGRTAVGKRINVMIDEDTWRVLGRIPAGARSRAINDALRAWVERRRRQDAVRELDALRGRLPVVSTAEVVRWIREDREQGH